MVMTTQANKAKTGLALVAIIIATLAGDVSGYRTNNTPTARRTMAAVASN